ncbi:SSI family serine proteinase inhibitor [Arthrobacter sp. 2YAF22_2]|uniref:SSI family serine proteinase inhibitor n=1 Tax=Arthrobacter sp. 2YAF22_2 TaxID=3233029 RepID=UPI003F91394E
MRKTLFPALFVLLAAAGLTACSPGGSGQGAPAGSGTASASAPASGTPSADAEATSPAPSPSATAPAAGPGQGNAELAIMIKPSASGQAVNYTLVCQNGVPAAESQHPTAAAACTALKGNAALLSPAPRTADKVCTQQYGGPQEATVTGSVDGTAVEAKFSLRDGCEIALWTAAKDVLGSTGGAV